MLWIKLAVFGVGSVGLGIVSRASLKAVGSHGFYRFFAWEAILALLLLNIDYWFVQPFAWYQLIAWALLLVGLFLVIYGVYLLRRIGQQDARREDAPLLAFEKTARLVVVGAYRYIRHPLYSSLLFLNWGIFFKLPSWIGGGLALLATFFLVLTARAEEQEDIRYFGDAYREYMQHTKMFVPFVF